MAADVETVEDKIISVMQASAVTNALTSNYTPSHVHNNSDSPSIPFLNLTDKQFIIKEMIQGTAAATSGNYGVFYIAPFQCTVIGAVCTFQTASASGSLQIEHLYPTMATGTGQSIMTTPFSLSATSNVVYIGSLVQNSLITLGRGDRIGLVVSGDLTAQVQVCVEVMLSY